MTNTTHDAGQNTVLTENSKAVKYTDTVLCPNSLSMAKLQTYIF